MQKNKQNRLKSAFSLIELSVVILIISILATGAISISTVAINNAKYKKTRDRMDAIYQAMGVYIAKNYKLPCPASLKLTKSSANYGEEKTLCADGEGDGVYASTTHSAVVYGAVPVKALALADDMAEDSFGTKFSYVVHSNFTVADNYPDATTDNDGFSFYDDISSADMLNIYQLPSGNKVEKVVFAIISHGANKYGGVNAKASSPNASGSADTEEGYNILSSITDNGSTTIDTAAFGTNSLYVGDITLTSINSNSDVFDDLVLFKTRLQIVSDFGLDFLLPCFNNSNTENFGWNGDTSAPANNAFAHSVAYRSTNCADPTGVRPSKRCGPFAGTWIDETICITY